MAERRGNIRRCIAADIRPDQTGGVGNLERERRLPFTTCDYTRTACVGARDVRYRSASNYGGVRRIEFVPAQIRGAEFWRERDASLAAASTIEARYNDFVPLVYGTAWYQPPIVFARNDGNLTHMEVLLGMGEIEDVVKVVVNDVEIPEGVRAART